MKKILLLLITFFCSFQVYSNYSNYSNYDDSYSNSSQQNSNSNSSGSGDNLLKEMNKKTSKALKVFNNLLANKNKNKQDFFSDVGSNPNSSQFEGNSSNGNVFNESPKETKFKL